MHIWTTHSYLRGIEVCIYPLSYIMAYKQLQGWFENQLEPFWNSLEPWEYLKVDLI